MKWWIPYDPTIPDIHRIEIKPALRNTNLVVCG